jgi:hypothetical protein
MQQKGLNYKKRATIRGTTSVISGIASREGKEMDSSFRSQKIHQSIR